MLNDTAKKLIAAQKEIKSLQEITVKLSKAVEQGKKNLQATQAGVEELRSEFNQFLSDQMAIPKTAPVARRAHQDLQPQAQSLPPSSSRLPDPVHLPMPRADNFSDNQATTRLSHVASFDQNYGRSHQQSFHYDTHFNENQRDNQDHRSDQRDHRSDQNRYDQRVNRSDNLDHRSNNRAPEQSSYAYGNGYPQHSQSTHQHIQQSSQYGTNAPYNTRTY